MIGRRSVDLHLLRFADLNLSRWIYFPNIRHTVGRTVFKDKDQLWSWDCIVKETLLNQSEKVDHLAHKNLCVLQGSGLSGIIKMIRIWPSLGKVTNTVHTTQKDVYGTTRTRGVKILPQSFTMLHDIFRIWRHLKSHAFQGTCLIWCSSTLA